MTDPVLGEVSLQSMFTLQDDGDSCGGDFMTVSIIIIWHIFSVIIFYLGPFIYLVYIFIAVCIAAILFYEVSVCNNQLSILKINYRP